MIKLIATDMDATFLKDDKTYDVQLFKKVSKTLQERRIPLVIASGNLVNILQSKFDNEDLKWLYLAGDNGSMIVHGNDMKKLYTIDKKIAQEYVDYLKSNKKCYCLLTAKSGQSYLFGQVPEHVLIAYQRHNLYINIIERVSDMPENDDITKVVTYADYSLNEQKKIVEALQKQFPMITVVTSGQQWIDAFHTQGGKHNAIAYFQNVFNVSPSETLAFGDSSNDLMMMKNVKYSVAMANSDDAELIEACAYQIGTNNEQSVLHVIDEWLEQGEQIFEKYKRDYS